MSNVLDKPIDKSNWYVDEPYKVMQEDALLSSPYAGYYMQREVSPEEHTLNRMNQSYKREKEKLLLKFEQEWLRIRAEEFEKNPKLAIYMANEGKTWEK